MTTAKLPETEDLALLQTNPPHRLLVEPIVRRALEEDLGRAGDVTTDLIIAPEQRARAVIAAREAGIVSGLIAASVALRLVDPAIRLEAHAADGSAIEAGAIVATVEGPARAI